MCFMGFERHDGANDNSVVKTTSVVANCFAVVVFCMPIADDIPIGSIFIDKPIDWLMGFCINQTSRGGDGEQ